MKWGFWPTVYWLIWFLGLVTTFAFWEFIAGEDKMGAGDIPMLTQVIIRFVPWWVSLPVFSVFSVWFFMHLARRYFNPAYVVWVNSR